MPKLGLTLSGAKYLRVPPRTKWVDVLKGLMIILVVIGHAWRGMNGRDLLPQELFEAVDARIYAFHMPVFFALSGWFFIASLKRSTLIGFWAKTSARILWPMVLWTYIFLVGKVVFGEYANAPIDLSEVLVLPIPGLYHLWFLWALFLLMIGFSIIKPAVENEKRLQFALTIMVAVVISLQNISLPSHFFSWVGPAIYYAPFFLVGVIFGHTKWLKFEVRHRNWLALSAILFLLVFWPAIDGAGLRNIGSLALTLCILMLSSGLRFTDKSRLTRFLQHLGFATMAIFLAHTIFSAVVRELLLAAGIKDILTHLVLGTALGVFGPLALLAIAQRTQTTRLLGFR